MAFSLGLALVAFALGAVFGPIWVRFLRAQNLGKQLNPSEPEEHRVKEGTPTMGGAIFVAPIIGVTLAFQALFGGRPAMLGPVALAAACAVLGAYDDFQTLVGRSQRSAGLPPGVKWGVELMLCLGAGLALALAGHTRVHVPFAGWFSWTGWVYVPFATLVLLSTINGVGITDGLDGLAATTGAIAFAAFWIIGLLHGDPATAALCGTVVGGLLAYLWFNAYPAQVFMGDTGSLPLGALLGIVALLLGEPFLLIPIGVVYVANVVSDILQVASNKLTRKRMFRYAPLHHHFRRPQVKDTWVTWPRQPWPEVWVVQRFWIAGAVGALAGLLLAILG
jgi:phospho-N-acetylmuramoyl-pentapeptide-transferase